MVQIAGIDGRNSLERVMSRRRLVLDITAWEQQLRGNDTGVTGLVQFVEFETSDIEKLENVLA
jgi:hypothetical protein